MELASLAMIWVAGLANFICRRWYCK